MLRNWLLTLVLSLLPALTAFAGGSLVVLSSRLEMQLEKGGLRSVVQLETFADQAPSRAFPVLSGAGALASWSASPEGVFRLVEPTSSAPGSPAFEQLGTGTGQLRLEFWTPLDDQELVLRTPPTPNGTWTLRGLPAKAPALGGNSAASAVAGTPGSVQGKLPADGLLWLTWKGTAEAPPEGVLEASELEVFLEAQSIRFVSTLRGFSRKPIRRVKWGSGMEWRPRDKEPAGRRSLEAGVEFPIRAGPWFHEVFEGEVALREGQIFLQLPQVEGLAPPLRGRITVTPVVPRSFRLGEGSSASALWFQESLADGARRWILLPGATPTALRFGISGMVPPDSPTPGIPRITAVTEPSTEAGKFLQTRIEYRIARPGMVRMILPDGVPPGRGSFEGEKIDLDFEKLEAPGEATRYRIGFEAKTAGTLRLICDHPAPDPLPSQGKLVLKLPVPEVQPGLFRWRGRLPPGLTLRSHNGGSYLRQERAPYPLRWMKSLFEGILVVLREAGVSVAFGFAGLIALYAFLFLQPPNQRTAYVGAVVLAAGALAFNVFTAASLAPGGKNSSNSELEAQYSPVLSRVREVGKSFTYFLGGSEDQAGRAAQAGTLRGYPASGGTSMLGGESWGVPGLPSGSELSPTGESALGRGPTFQVGGSPGPRPAEEAKVVEPPPEDWEFARIPGGEEPVSFSLEVDYVASHLPAAAGVVLGLLVLALLGVLRVRGGKPVLGALVVLGAIMLPLDVAFPREASLATGCLLAGLLAVTLYRVVLDGIELWEKTRQELERRRLKALSRSGSMTQESGGRDTGGGLYSGPNLQKNECTYEDVFPEDEGITFLMGDS